MNVKLESRNEALDKRPRSHSKAEAEADEPTPTAELPSADCRVQIAERVLLLSSGETENLIQIDTSYLALPLRMQPIIDG